MDSKEDDLTDFGSHTIGSDTSEDVSLVQDLERELGAVVQHHRIPPDDLQQLFEVLASLNIIICINLICFYTVHYIVTICNALF